VSPESLDFQIPVAPNPAATRFTPSFDMAIDVQDFTAPGDEVFSIQVTPELVERQMLP